MRFARVVSLFAVIFCTAFGQEPAEEGALLRARCGRGQLVHRVSVFEDGVVEAECGPQPCGISGVRCRENQAACRDRSDVLAGMHWSSNGQSLILRCCTLEMPDRIYVGTDLVSHGSFYSGGLVARNEAVGTGGVEYDYVSNLRMELDGVRVWVYRLMCPSDGTVANATSTVISTTISPPLPSPAFTNAQPSLVQQQTNIVGRTDNPLRFGQQGINFDPATPTPASFSTPFVVAAPPAAPPAASPAASSAFASPISPAALPAAPLFAPPVSSPAVASFPAPPPAVPQVASPFFQPTPILPAAPVAFPATPLAAQSPVPSVSSVDSSITPASQPLVVPWTAAVEQPTLAEEERRRQEDYARRRQILLNRFGPAGKRRAVSRQLSSDGPIEQVHQQVPDIRLQQRNRRSGPFCFHGETQVQTESGRRAMKDLRIGEHILVMNEDQLIYAPVTTFLHRMPEQEAVFFTITTSDSNTIRLTSEHLLYTTKCSGPIEMQQDWKLMFAREIQLGDCLIGVSDGIRPEKVTGITEEMGYGVYAPYTESGTVVADNVVASCHSVHKDSVMQNAFVALYTKLRAAWSYLAPAETDFVQLPWLLQYIVSSVHTIL